MAAAWKIIGIKIREESDLDKRFKAISLKSRFSYGELLEKWIGTEEKAMEQNASTQLSLFEPTSPPRPHEADDERLRKLEEQLEALAAAVKSQPPAPNPTEAPKLPTPADEEATIKYIKELSTAGISSRKIAEKLEAEGRPLLRGMFQWNHTKIANILKNA